jgi:endonuclease/exonuclease/phosphatase family metal-dependent hydrolase
MTYNIRAGLGMDRKRSLDRIADVIRGMAPDAVALQEVDLARTRSESVDQPRLLGELLDMHVLHGHSFIDNDGGRYGNALLTHAPGIMVRHANLPGPNSREPRSVMRVEVMHRESRLTLVNTHLGLTRSERRDQVRALIGDRWLDPNVDEPLVLCGDLNLGAGRRAHGQLANTLRDAFAGARWPAFSTWPSRLPVRRLDHVFYTGPLAVVERRVVNTVAAKRASDHLPLVVDFVSTGRRDAASTTTVQQ